MTPPQVTYRLVKEIRHTNEYSIFIGLTFGMMTMRRITPDGKAI